MKAVRVLVDASTLRVGGGPIIVAHELGELRRALGPEAALLLVESESGIRVPDAVGVERLARPSRDPATGQGFFAWLGGGAAARVRETGADVYLSFTNWLPEGLGVPSILYLHSPYALELKVGAPRDLVSRLPRYLASRWSLWRADAVVVQTPTARDQLAGWRLGPDLSRVLPSVPSGSWMREMKADDRFAARLEAERARADLWLFYPSLRAAHKNMDGLARALNLLAAKGRRVGLVLPSGGIAPGELASEVAFLDFDGLTQAQMAAAYDFADAVVFPSHLETAGLGLVEGLARGRPLLASDRRFTADLCGDAALRFDPALDADIAAAIERFADDPDREARSADRVARWAEARAAGSAELWKGLMERLVAQRR